jgi:hypothetical protein
VAGEEVDCDSFWLKRCLPAELDDEVDGADLRLASIEGGE